MIEFTLSAFYLTRIGIIIAYAILISLHFFTFWLIIQLYKAGKTTGDKWPFWFLLIFAIVYIILELYLFGIIKITII